MQPTKKRRKSPLMIIIPEELDDLLADLLPPVVSLHLQSEASDLFLSSRMNIWSSSRLKMTAPSHIFLLKIQHVNGSPSTSRVSGRRGWTL